MSAAQQAADLKALSALVDDVYGNGSDRPALVGPDPHSFRGAANNNSTLTYLADFTRAMGSLLSAVTHHEYIEINATNVLIPEFLDTTYNIAVQVVRCLHALRGCTLCAVCQCLFP